MMLDAHSTERMYTYSLGRVLDVQRTTKHHSGSARVAERSTSGSKDSRHGWLRE